MSNVIDSLPIEYRELIADLVGAVDSSLLAALRSQREPTQDQREVVEDILSSAFTGHLSENHEPTERGVAIDNALGAFILRWPIVSD